jgi:hypothetical protein
MRRKQCVPIRDKMSSFKCLNGGIPQGTKLGPILFAVLVNSLLRDWNFRIKFVDDLTTIEFIPRCSLSVTSLLVNDIYDYASTTGMRLNSKKCKEMIINYLQYRLPFPRCITGWWEYNRPFQGLFLHIAGVQNIGASARSSHGCHIFY